MVDHPASPPIGRGWASTGLIPSRVYKEACQGSVGGTRGLAPHVTGLRPCLSIPYPIPHQRAETTLVPAQASATVAVPPLSVVVDARHCVCVCVRIGEREAVCDCVCLRACDFAFVRACVRACRKGRCQGR